MALPENTLRRLAFDYMRLWQDINQALETKLMLLEFPALLEAMKEGMQERRADVQPVIEQMRKIRLRIAPGVVQSLSQQDAVEISEGIRLHLRSMRQLQLLVRKVELLTPAELDVFSRHVLYYHMVKEPGPGELSLVNELMQPRRPPQPVNT